MSYVDFWRLIRQRHYGGGLGGVDLPLTANCPIPNFTDNLTRPRVKEVSGMNFFAPNINDLCLSLTPILTTSHSFEIHARLVDETSCGHGFSCFLGPAAPKAVHFHSELAKPVYGAPLLLLGRNMQFARDLSASSRRGSQKYLLIDFVISV